MKLKDFQDKFQRAILAGDDAVLKDIPDGPHETKENLLGIYRDAYVLRLIDVIGADHERLHTYLGDDSFRAMARAYIATNPSRHRNARWFAQRLPEFLRSHEPYAKQPVLSELAALERALNDAFDGADAPVVSYGRSCCPAAGNLGRHLVRAAPYGEELRGFDQRRRDLDRAQGGQRAASRAWIGDIGAYPRLAARDDAHVPRDGRGGENDVGGGRQGRALRRPVHDASRL